MREVRKGGGRQGEVRGGEEVRGVRGTGFMHWVQAYSNLVVMETTYDSVVYMVCDLFPLVPAILTCFWIVVITLAQYGTRAMLTFPSA